MEPFATVEDYSKRYGELGDAGRAETLLSDATGIMLSAYEEFFGAPYEPGSCKAFDRNAESVCCLLVNRVLSAPAAMAGATQFSQGAGGYTASVSYGSALGEMYLGATQRRTLGLTGQLMRSLHPAIGGDGELD